MFTIHYVICCNNQMSYRCKSTTQIFIFFNNAKHEHIRWWKKQKDICLHKSIIDFDHLSLTFNHVFIFEKWDNYL